jgi:hypothetical protein
MIQRIQSLYLLLAAAAGAAALSFDLWKATLTKNTKPRDVKPSNNHIRGVV